MSDEKVNLEIKEMLEEVFDKTIHGVHGVQDIFGREFPRLEFAQNYRGKRIVIYYEIQGEARHGKDFFG